MATWPLSVELNEDELFSSWLIRNALAHGMSPIDFTATIWEKKRVWTTDIDRKLPDSKVNKLSKSTGVKADRIHTSTLYSLLKNISSKLTTQGFWPWVLHYGVRNRSYKAGLQFCPDCFAEDMSPYFRRSWRIAWNVGCNKHGKYFLDACQECNSPIEPNKLDEMNKLICICSNCGSDYRNQSSENCDQQNLNLQEVCNENVRLRLIEYHGHTYRSEDWFELLRFYILIISRCSNTKLIRLPRMLEKLEVDYIDVNPLGLGFEYLKVKERSRILSGCEALFDFNQDEFICAINSLKITKNTFIGISRKIPFLFEPIFNNTQKERSYKSQTKGKSSNPASKSSVLKMYQRLLRKHRLIIND